MTMSEQVSHFSGSEGCTFKKISQRDDWESWVV